MKHKERTYFDFARWITLNYYQFSVHKDAWINTRDRGKNKGKTYTDRELFKTFIDESNDCR